jgi:hypothetical protein
MFQIRSDIYDIAPEQLHALLTQQMAELSFRSRLIGYQMFLDTPELQCVVETMDEAHPTYNFRATYLGDQAGADAWVQALCKLLDTAGLLYSLDYVEEDADGNALGEEWTRYAPNFDERYRARSSA